MDDVVSSIDLPVSLGEALDKLSILDIKLDKIKDERKKDVEKEYNILYENLKIYQFMKELRRGNHMRKKT